MEWSGLRVISPSHLDSPSLGPAHSGPGLVLSPLLSCPAQASRVERSGPEEGNNLPVCVLYGSWNFWNYCLPARRRKKIPFSSRTGSCSTFETAAVAVTSLAVSFGQGTDYPVVIVTANRKCPQQVKPGALFRCLRDLFSPRRGSFVPNRARKSSAEPRPPFRLAPLCDLLSVYCAKSPW